MELADARTFERLVAPLVLGMVKNLATCHGAAVGGKGFVCPYNKRVGLVGFMPEAGLAATGSTGTSN